MTSKNLKERASKVNLKEQIEMHYSIVDDNPDGERRLTQPTDYYNELCKSTFGAEPVIIFNTGSGIDKNTPEFQRLLTESKGDELDMILKKSITRLNKSISELLCTVKSLSLIGVSVFIEIDNLDVSKNGDTALLMCNGFTKQATTMRSAIKRASVRRKPKAGRQ